MLGLSGVPPAVSTLEKGVDLRGVQSSKIPMDGSWSALEVGTTVGTVMAHLLEEFPILCNCRPMFFSGLGRTVPPQEALCSPLFVVAVEVFGSQVDFYVDLELGLRGCYTLGTFGHL